MERLARDAAATAAMGLRGYAHVLGKFSRAEFGRRLDDICARLARAAAVRAKVAADAFSATANAHVKKES